MHLVERPLMGAIPRFFGEGRYSADRLQLAASQAIKISQTGVEKKRKYLLVVTPFASTIRVHNLNM